MTTEEYVRNWLAKERAYTLDKFGIDSDNDHTPLNGWEAWWTQQFDNYLMRAQVLGLDTVNGRQAAAKFVATAVGFLESVVRLHGPLPEPGVTSGENLDRLFDGV
jgi:hypothetical protein